MKVILSILSSMLYALTLGVITGATNIDSNYLLSCGAPSTVATTPALDGRTWKSDTDFALSDNHFPSTVAAVSKDPNFFNQIPFSTARIFQSNFTYTFPVSPGPKLLRLFFNPSDYSPSSSLTFSASNAYLTLQTNSGQVLLRNFSAYAANPSSDSFNKEFYVHVSGSNLQLTFLPTPPSSYAFLNGIEVVSVPENLYVKSLGQELSYVSDPTIQFEFGNFTALELAYRVNVGGSDISPAGDSGNLYRKWVMDDSFLLIGSYRGQTGYNSTATIKYTANTPNYTAPVSVYNTLRWMGPLTVISEDLRKKTNITWGFKVELGFDYLVRLHWCELSPDVNSCEFRVFDVYLNELMADKDVDIYDATGGIDIPTYKDYVVDMNGKLGGQDYLQLALHPNTDQPRHSDDILLNGVEIFKINRSDGSLNAPNPSRPPQQTSPTPSQQRKTASHIVPLIIGAVTGTIVIALLICFLLIASRRKQSKTLTNSSGTGSSKSKFLLFSFGKSSSSSNNTTKRSGSTLPSHLCRRYTLSELKLSTSDFSPSLIIGHGGFGNVYKATLPTDSNPTTPVAIKRLNPLSGQGAREFTTEIELLSKLRHLHLVSLIGYCDDSSEMILVYEFMSHGTLRDHLYPNPNPPLPWTRRLKICIDSARGLHYLHTGTHRMIIHRDVKSTNILLDHNFVAKVSDFGLSKLGGVDSTHVSTAVKGSFGYVDPEYYRRQQLTEKSDVYSFGVVLFEVLCGRAAVNPALPKEQVNLRIWGRRNWASETLETIVDPNLKGQIGEECLRKFGEVAESCVREDGASRPAMVDVIWGLEFALQLQMESGGMMMSGDLDSGGGVDFFSTNNVNSPSAGAAARLVLSSDENLWASSVNHSSSGLFTSSATSDRLGGSTDVFSQIFNPEGR